MQAGPIAAYIGFDCTADSLHVGSLVQIMILRLLQKHGHKPVVLLGGGTTRIGDPSGKDESRQLLTDEAIAANMVGIRRCFTPFLRFGEGPSQAMLANNADWLDTLGYIPLLREVGVHFTINRMLGFDSVKLRLEREQPLTFLEFNYMILQSYDFRELSRRHGVTLQIGGSDQWGNIVAGIELTRRTDAKAGFGLTTPLITTASGGKMGKTAPGRCLADRGSAFRLRLLAILAQHRGWRCRPFPAAVHRPAVAGDRSAGSAGWSRNQRGEEDPGNRGDVPRARPRTGRRGCRNRAPSLRSRRGGGELAECDGGGGGA